MSITYGKSRNVLTSIKEFIAAELLADGLSAWTLLIGFEQAYSTKLPVIALRNGTKNLKFVELGSTQTTKEYVIFIDIFAQDGGQKNDSKDWLTETIINGCAYKTYVAGNTGVVTGTATTKRVIILTLRESDVNLNRDLSQLDAHDRNRTLVTLTVTTGEVS